MSEILIGLLLLKYSFGSKEQIKASWALNTSRVLIPRE